MGGVSQSIVQSGTWSPTWTGFSADPTAGTGTANYTLTGGKLCDATMSYTVSGTSNATTLTVTMPFVARYSGYYPCKIMNSGTYVTTGMLFLTAGSNIANIYRDALATAFTASGGKHAQFSIVYEIQP